MNLADADRHLIFRNWLRNHPQDAAEYQRLKEQLAERFPTDREAYTQGKDALVARILGKALQEGSDSGGLVQGART